jgi:hypothetical protein
VGDFQLNHSRNLEAFICSARPLEILVSEGMRIAVRRFFLAVSIALAGCTSAAPTVDPAGTAATQDAATRSSPVIVGRPARVFVMAGFGKSCEPVAAPEITITQPPEKGDVSFIPGQETTIQYSAAGTCVGQKTTGTGIYYTARAGTSGTDRFAVSAKLASGEVATRAFEVRITE